MPRVHREWKTGTVGQTMVAYVLTFWTASVVHAQLCPSYARNCHSSAMSVSSCPSGYMPADRVTNNGATTVYARCLPTNGQGWAHQASDQNCANYCGCRRGTYTTSLGFVSITACRAACIQSLGSACTMFSYSVTQNSAAGNHGGDPPGTCYWNVPTLATSQPYTHGSCQIQSWIGEDLFRVVQSRSPTRSPTSSPTGLPTKSPSTRPPTRFPTQSPTGLPTNVPSTRLPTQIPTRIPTHLPTRPLTQSPTQTPTLASTVTSTLAPTGENANTLPTSPPILPTVATATQRPLSDKRTDEDDQTTLSPLGGIVIAVIVTALVCLGITFVVHKRWQLTLARSQPPSPQMFSANPVFIPTYAECEPSNFAQQSPTTSPYEMPDPAQPGVYDESRSVSRRAALDREHYVSSSVVSTTA